jgi:transcriptional regulator with XRE-family HTH domain
MSINDLIRRGRKRLKMTEQRFADAIGVSRGAVQQWEKEGGTAPARKHQQAVADLIGVTLGELMSGSSDKYPPASEASAQVSEPTASLNFQIMAEARVLLEAMNSSGQSEAIKYMRYLVTQYPANFSSDAADGPGATIPDRTKAA